MVLDQPASSDTNAAPGVPAPADAVSRARRLVNHGEPRLAWDALLGAGALRSPDAQRLEIRILTELGRPAEADSLLAQTPPRADARSAFLYALQRARLNYEAGRTGEALDLLASVDGAPVDRALGAYADVLAVRLYLTRDEPDSAAKQLALARDRGIPEPLRAETNRERVRVFRALGRSWEALAASGEAIESATDARERREAMQDRYAIAWECGDQRQATQAARRLFDASRNSAEAEACALDLVGRADAGGVPTDALLDCANVLAVRGRTDALRRTLRVLDARSPRGHDGEALRLLWADYHYQTGDYSRAIALSRPSYSDVALRRQSMLVMARSLRKLGKREEAARLYEQFATTYPNDTLAADALYAAAALYDQDERVRESDRMLDRLRRSYPSTFQGWAAAMRRADRLSKDGRGDEAIAIYDQWLARSRRTDEAALFYLAREYDRTRGSGSGAMILDELRALNPYSFYVSPDVAEASRGPVRGSTGSVGARDGSLIDWIRDADTARHAAYERVLADAGTARTTPDNVAGQAIDRGVWFLEAGFRDWAESELEVARRRCGNSAREFLLLARVYEDCAMPWRSVRLYENARWNLEWERRREHVDDFRYLTYPLPYPAQVLDGAARNDVPPNLLYAMIREESRFESDVVSRAGAVGLMQLMPETAKRVARQIDLDLDDDALGDPAVNVTLGAWYAADLLREGRGSVSWMLAAYNAGPGAADRWVRKGAHGQDAIDDVDSIDYRETRGYVKSVVESANVYRTLYFGGGRDGSGEDR